MTRKRHTLADVRAQADAAASGQPLPTMTTRRTPRALESAQGMALIQWADLQARTGARACLRHLRHLPNGGARDARTGGRLKAEGVRRGTWDYVLPVVTRMPFDDETWIRYPGLWIELKIESERRTKRGGLSVEQAEFGAFLVEQGYATVVAYTWEEARDAIVAYLDGNAVPHLWAPEVSHGAL